MGDQLRTGAEIVADVIETVTERRKGYGSPKVNFERIATGWQEIFKDGVTAQKVALAMMWLKISRLIESPDQEDGILDVMGYAACYADCGKQEPTVWLADGDFAEEITQNPNAGAKNSTPTADPSMVKRRDTANPEYLDAPEYPDWKTWMLFETCDGCPSRVHCKTKVSCREVRNAGSNGHDHAE